MKLRKKKAGCAGIRISCVDQGKEIGRAYLYVLRNDLHKEPFGFLEDVFVDEKHRGKGVASLILGMVIGEAHRRGCYKLVATSRYERPKVHELYTRLGFRVRGLEFRLDLPAKR